MGCAEVRSPFAGSLRVSLKQRFFPLPGQEGGHCFPGFADRTVDRPHAVLLPSCLDRSGKLDRPDHPKTVFDNDWSGRCTNFRAGESFETTVERVYGTRPTGDGRSVCRSGPVNRSPRRTHRSIQRPPRRLKLGNCCCDSKKRFDKLARAVKIKSIICASVSPDQSGES